MTASLRPSLPILLGAAVTLSIAMGLRQSLGLFMAPATQDLGVSVAQFTMAIAVQNLGWGILQPFAGAAAARWGFRPVLLGGVVCYLAGLAVMALAQGAISLTIGAGVLMGVALACTGSGMALAVAARPVPTALRSSALGLVSAAGSAGALMAAPIGQLLADGWGWRVGVWGFLLLGLAMLPAAWIAGRVDRVPIPPPPPGEAPGMWAALGRAMTHTPFLVMAAAYSVCGLQLVFLTTHLPSYLTLCGQDPMLSAKALGLIGGFNVLGSLFFGWAGGRWNKGVLLGAIYLVRSLVLGLYFAWPPSEASTMVFAAIMGFLWLGVAPLVSGLVVEMFGLRFQAMIQGLAFMSHQFGSFLGAFGGGVLFDLNGDYALAWKLGVGMGLVAGAVQFAYALRGAAPPAPRPAIA
ncbi:MFS transporter [Roseomonas terrae]|jgi:predicted MFS family arabinose efflux permease|uniref:MFS transporter n=1 Tax=Neoroseomonas terrae TaxID=424799 RepID=A0ABS5EJQ9_9PROT|nr:MFS transporter [Neoroseomonas terrae]MBR0651265.1 MFS transporter [Neoroseomonas terrae]